MENSIEEWLQTREVTISDDLLAVVDVVFEKIPKDDGVDDGGDDDDDNYGNDDGDGDDVDDHEDGIENAANSLV